MTNKNIAKYISEKYNDYTTSISDASKSNSGRSLIESDNQIYNFDEICSSIFTAGNKPTSADGIRVSKSKIEVIEFKSGLKQKVTKNGLSREDKICKALGDVCDQYWMLFWKNQTKERKELVSSIRFKAIESYIILEKHLFPNCEPCPRGHNCRLEYTVVIDEDDVDGIEDTLAELAQKVPKSNSISEIRQALKRLHHVKDSNGDSYFYDEVNVLSAKDFYSKLKIN